MQAKLNPMSSFRALYEHRYMLYATTLNDIRARYTGTIFGLLWMAIYPFLFLSLYAVVYTLILKVKLEQYSSFDYVLVIFAGLIPFIGFSEALALSTVSVVSNKGLLRNTMFPVELLPVKAVLTSSISMLVGLAGLVLILWARGQFSVVQFAVIAIFAMQLIFSIGVAWIVAALNVFFRDLGQIVGVIVLFLMLISPIGYTRDMIPNGMLPLLYPNPLFYLIELYRSVLIFGFVPWTFALVFLFLSIGIFLFGYNLFRRLKPIFSEYV